MKKSIKASIATLIIGLIAFGAANADTISVGTISVAPDGSGGVLWTYPIIFDNSHISSTQPTSFNLNDFGALKTTGSLPSGYSFTPGVAFTLSQPFVGPNFGLPGFVTNNASARDVVITFTANADMGLPSVTFNLVLDTSLTGMGGLANFFSQDIVQTGLLHGHPNAAQQLIFSPSAQVPDGGSAVALLGIALAGIEGVRRMFRARKT